MLHEQVYFSCSAAISCHFETFDSTYVKIALGDS